MTTVTQAGAVPSIPRWRLLFAVASVPGVYLVLALSAILSLGIAAAVVYLAVTLASNAERVPVRLIIPIALIAVGGVYGFFAVVVGVLKSLSRKPGAEIAITLNAPDEPELWHFIGQVCSEVGCALPDHILVSAGPSFHVRQGAVEVPTGRLEGRILTLGCPLLRSLTVSELRAVLAHEFAHFTGNDTLYSAFVAPVYVSIGASLQQMEHVFSSTDRNAGWMSLPMLLPSRMLGVYLWTFHRLNASTSRLREARADALAALHAGSDSFASALRKVVREGGLFEAVHARHVLQGLSRQRAFTNYYEAFREIADSATDAQDDFEKQALADKGTPGDAHPPFSQRLAALPDAPTRLQDTRLSRELFARPKELEESLTQFFTAVVAKAMESAGPVYYAPVEASAPHPSDTSRPTSTGFTPPIMCAGCGKVLPAGVTFCPDCNAE